MRLRPILVVASILSIASPSFANDDVAPSADAALAALKEGNARFAAGESTFAHVDQARRCETNDRGQHPIAAVLSCADSRVPPELVFDAGLGDLFVTRVAGNVAGGDEVGTLEYGAAHVGVPLIVVMGHGKCGAVTAVVRRDDVGPTIAKLVAPIGPAVDEARAQAPAAAEARLIALATRANVRRAMRDVLAQSDAIRALVEAKKLRVVGAVYDVHAGTVEWLADDETLAAAGASEAHATPVAHHADAPASVGHDIRHEAPAKPRAAGHGEMLHDAKPEAHDVPAVREVKRAHEPTHASGPKDAHSTSDAHDSKDAHGSPKAAHGSPKDAHEPGHGAAPAHESTSAHDEPAEATSLVARQGLLVPAAFMAAGSALSGTIVYALKSRPTTAPSAPHADPTPATH